MRLRSPRARREFARFFKFTVVGAIGFVVDFSVFNTLSIAFGVYSVAASACSFIVAVISNFIWNRLWTYPDSRSKPMGLQAGQFAFINAIGLFIRTPIFALAERPLIGVAGRMVAGIAAAGLALPRMLLPHDPTILGRNLALAVAVIVVMFWNFGANRIWTYSDVP